MAQVSGVWVFLREKKNQTSKFGDLIGFIEQFMNWEHLVW